MATKHTTLEELMADIATMNIGALRDLAREYSIVPQNYCRQTLIEKIVSVFKGEAPAEVRKKPGRPPKSGKMPINVKDGVAMDPTTFDDVDPSLPRTGILEVMPDGYGFVRTHNYSTVAGKDYYLAGSTIARMGLRNGDKVKVSLRQYPDRTAPTAVYVVEINDQPCAEVCRTPFERMQAVFPNKRICLGKADDYSLRALDLVAPIGKGQRGLIVAPPKTGKTILLKKIAMAVKKFHPEIHLTVLLIDERPEEVTDFQESVDCEVVYSTFDQQPQNHTRIAELVFANARRRVEQGQDVMILLDSITRLGRAYNQTAQQTGRTLTGGLDISALQEPKKMFGMGRNVKTGGSLTVLATALVDTGSKMDDIIYEEFKGTGNMEICLDRRLSEKRIFPAINLNASGTRREDLLLTQSQLEGMFIVRKMLSREDSAQATEELLEVVMTTADNEETIDTLKRLVRSAEARRAMKNTAN